MSGQSFDSLSFPLDIPLFFLLTYYSEANQAVVLNPALRWLTYWKFMLVKASVRLNLEHKLLSS